MRFLHIADLHLGRMLADVSLIKEQKAVLDEIVKLSTEHDADAVLIAGDVYQRAAPQAEAMELFDGFISKLCALGKRVFAISGNHDSAQRISYFSKLIQNSGVYVSEKFEGRLQRIELQDEYGKLYVHMLPFIKPVNVKLKYPEAEINTYTDAVRTVLSQSGVDFTKRNILIAHQYITGGEMAGSEEKTIGTLDNVDADVFEGFDYVALGHLHRAQKMEKNAVRYAGSPLKYSFSEISDRKSAALVELNEKGDVNVKLLLIPQSMELRRLRATVKELMDMPYSEDYIWAEVTDEEVPVDAQRMLRTVFPNLLRFAVNNSKTKTDMDVSGAESVKDLDAEALFRDFYAEQNNGVFPGEAQMDLFRELFTWEEKEQ